MINKNVIIRDVPDDILLKIDLQAKKMGLSRNKFIIKMFEYYTINDEIQNLENRFAEIVKMFNKQIEINNCLLVDVINTLEKIAEKVGE